MKPVWGSHLCEDPSCYRGGPHFPGEYGCKCSDVWRCPEGVHSAATCSARLGASHRAGCGCPGDPSIEVQASKENHR